ncbi:membrane bound O-acyl transferase family-domain-containing protein [Podospora australis]|uniref:Membrane bound O-acyl transferase family-domain-containing protein n=1 Tax=Podospora australis TaxID=1536484 RepID=A0AAN6X3S0_9PEZI|nr:membrane bound O-acyl transferase family-domain-containing protein [Podospora australis]
MKGEPEVGFSSGHDEQNRKLEIRNRKDAESPSDEKSHGDEGEYEYKWQPYPSHAPFFVRLGWVASLYTSFRGAGWNFAISSLPAPPSALSGRVATDAIPLRSRSGYSISPSVRHFILTRLWHITWSWLLIDLFTLTMRYDPYMTLGPDWSSPSHPLYTSPSFSIKSPPPLPEFLTGLPPWVLGLARNVSAIGGIFAGLFLYSYLWQLVCFFCIHPSKEDLWRYPTLFGGFEQVYERGLQGFWGAWWHQTFRMGFTAPAEYLFSLLPPANDKKMTRAMVEMALAFLQSGILHACGGASAASLVPTNFWDPIWFFGMQGVGVLIQNILWQWQVVPKRGRIGNLVFVGVWLHFTGHKFIQDMARAGVWLFEPVPFSVLRWLGLGDQRESVWRWDEAYGFLWYWGKNFWERGLRVL